VNACARDGQEERHLDPEQFGYILDRAGERAGTDQTDRAQTPVVGVDFVAEMRGLELALPIPLHMGIQKVSPGSDVDEKTQEEEAKACLFHRLEYLILGLSN
jgi:hypothetical protein